MAVNKGKDGGFYVGSTLVTFMDSWTVTRGRQVEELTAFGEDWNSNIGTVANWTGTFSGTLDRADAQQAALLDQLEDGTVADVAVRFSIDDTTTYWAGSAIVDSDSINSTAKGVVKYSGNLTGNGALVYVGS